MKNNFKIYHWEFYTESNDDNVYVYENREGDVLGYINGYTYEELEDKFSDDYTEDEVYEFIENNIEWF